MDVKSTNHLTLEIMNRILSIAAGTAALAFGMTSCLKTETVVETANDVFEQHLPDVDSATISVKHSIEYLGKFKGGDKVRDKINNTIVQLCYGSEYDGVSIEEANRSVVDDLWNDYKKEAGDEYKQYLSFSSMDDSFPLTLISWEFITNGVFGETYQNLQTYDVESYIYQGGAHGMSTDIPHIIDQKTGKLVKEENLFIEGYMNPVAKLIKTSLKARYGSPDDPDSEYSSMTEENMVPNGMCGVSANGVFWRYQPYEIACYAAGVIEATVSWDDLKPYLNPEFVK